MWAALPRIQGHGKKNALQWRRGQRNKDSVREIKQTEKVQAQNSSDLCVFCFDLEKVLELPYANVSSMYYKRKLAVYNLSIFDICTKEATCYMWPETVAGRGSSEISSCVYDYISKRGEEGYTRISMYSDKCGGQNRNRGMVTMMLEAVQQTPVKQITHRFFESGHSQNENDSVHSVIERARKRCVPILTPDEYCVVARMAAQTRPYTVVEMGESDFKDFKKTSESLKNFKIGSVGETINWLEINEFHVDEAMEFQVKYKYWHDEASHNELDVLYKSRSPKPVLNSEVISEHRLISKSKYTDLMDMVSHDLIPRQYHAFYQNLPHDGTL